MHLDGVGLSFHSDSLRLVRPFLPGRLRAAELLTWLKIENKAKSGEKRDEK